MIIYEGVEFESPEEVLLGNPSVNYTKQIEQKYVPLLYRYHFNEIPNYIEIWVENITICLVYYRLLKWNRKLQRYKYGKKLSLLSLQMEDLI